MAILPDKKLLRPDEVAAYFSLFVKTIMDGLTMVNLKRLKLENHKL